MLGVRQIRVDTLGERMVMTAAKLGSYYLVVDEIITLLNNHGYYIQDYADDMVILIKRKHPETIS